MTNSVTRINFLIDGPLACFRRPEIQGDLVSYDVINPPVAARVLESAHALRKHCWVVDRIVALSPIIQVWRDLDGADGRRKRVHALENVRYCVSARLVDQNTGADFDFQLGNARQRLSGPREVFLGLREFTGELTVAPSEYDVEAKAAALFPGIRELGWMFLHLVSGNSRKPEFFRAIMKDGVIDLTDREELLKAM